MNHFKKFSSINRFKDVYKSVVGKARFVGLDPETNEPIFDRAANIPKINFTATVKIHGANAAVSLHKDGKMYAQSRSSETSDNAGFWQFAISQQDRKEYFKNGLQNYLDEGYDQAIVFGEFAGQGIQKGVAVSQTEKHFYPFQVQVFKAFKNPEDVYQDQNGKTIYEEWAILPIEEVEKFRSKAFKIIPVTDFGVKFFEIDFNDDAKSGFKFCG